MRLRPASRSVMSASSCCVTIGIVRQPMVRFLAIAWRIGSTSATSTAPNLLKSGSGGSAIVHDHAANHAAGSATFLDAGVRLRQGFHIVERNACLGQFRVLPKGRRQVHAKAGESPDQPERTFWLRL